MALSFEKPRLFTEYHYVISVPVKGSTKIYAGALVGLTSGFNRQLVAGDVFNGVALETVDNSTGANGDLSVLVALEGIIDRENITSVTDGTSVSSIVYASDSDTLTLSSNSNVNSVIGYVVKWNPTNSTSGFSFKAASIAQ